MSERAADARVVRPRMSVASRMARVWQYRELLVTLTRKELKVKYKNSALGFAWSLLNPLLYLVVFYVAFDVVLGAGIPSFPIFLLSGLLVWNLYSVGLGSATGSIVGNASIVKKVSFPREILSLASVGSALVHFFLQAIVLFVVLAVARWDVGWRYTPLLVPALIILLAITAGLGLLLAAVNVYARDTQHLLELALLAWFWLTPIIYPFTLIYDRGGWVRAVFMVNPIAAITVTFQRAIYDIGAFVTTDQGTVTSAQPPQLDRLEGVSTILPPWGFADYALYLGYAAAVAAVVLVVGFWVFGRIEADFAQEL